MGSKEAGTCSEEGQSCSRAVTKHGEMICKYGRQFIKWICSIGKKLLYSWGPKSPKGQWVGCMTVEENSSNLFELNKVNNLKTWIFILQPTTSAHPAMFLADTPISTTFVILPADCSPSPASRETTTAWFHCHWDPCLRNLVWISCQLDSWINNIPLFTISSLYFVDSKRWILIFWDFWTMNQNEKYVHHSEIRWLATPRTWRFGRGYDKPIQGSGDRRSPSTFQVVYLSLHPVSIGLGQHQHCHPSWDRKTILHSYLARVLRWQNIGADKLYLNLGWWPYIFRLGKLYKPSLATTTGW